MTGESLLVETRSAEETQEFGRTLGRLLQPGDLLLLHGTLGAGKTTLTQGVAWGAEVEDYAHSPTFVIVHEYSGRIPIFHLDLYRLSDPMEIHDLALDEMLDRGACMVEWPERAGAVLPAEHLSITLDFANAPDQRRLRLDAHGRRYNDLIAGLTG